MRAVVQRVSRAEVRILSESDAEDHDGAVVARRGFDGEGLVVLLGVTHEDGVEEADLLADRVWGQRILRGERSCAQADAPLVVVSQFTLYGDVRRGRRPSWSAAAPPAVSRPLYERFVSRLRAGGAQVHTGDFGAAMEVDLVNDGPVTLVVDTDELRRPRSR
ncbi:MAG: D-aminoacyl-tRNA deacylase [Nesterenkonia sp.]|nr:D-aminoacyl-tRNA deacylase [Nesterenkonia sp.]